MPFHLPCFNPKNAEGDSNSTTGPITLTYKTPAGSKSENFDFLVVACDPRSLPISNRTPLENTVKDALTSFTFRTSLFRATRPERPQLPATGGPRAKAPNYAVRFFPEPLSKTDGDLYAFRDEVMARDPEYQPSPNGTTWITTYQLDGQGLLGRDPVKVAAQLDEKRDAVIAEAADKHAWIDFQPEGSPDQTEIVDYFPHFDPAELTAGLPWQVRDNQGDKNTLYVSSFTCFESVLHIYLYEQELMRPDGRVAKIFPKNKDARIAVLGAGPAGILFASQHLATKGYKNFTIFEKSARFGGKTMTHHRPAPADASVNVPCELGTCYLSLGYEPMFPLFEKYDAGEVVALDKDTNAFRSVVDRSVAKDDQELENGVEYGAWTLRRNGPFKLWEQVQMGLAGLKYVVVHYATMGMTLNDCMPAEPPTESNVLENLARLVGLAEDEEDLTNHKGEVNAGKLYQVMKNEKRDKDDTVHPPRGLFDILDDFGDLLDNVDAWFSVSDLEKACKTVFNTSFAKFLDDNGMEELKSVFIYGYQVQGYGTIEKIPAYYGYVTGFRKGKGCAQRRKHDLLTIFLFAWLFFCLIIIE